MFVPLTETERQTFLAQTSGNFIPGYTGHCPTLKFHFGRCYGSNTKDILQELKDKGILKNARREQYRSDDFNQTVLTPVKYTKDQNQSPVADLNTRSAKYILGYTGYIPGLNFRYGKSYSRAADDSMLEFQERQVEMKRKWQTEQYYKRASSAPKMASIRSRDEVKKALKNYEDKFKYKGRAITPECPPIAGYTGHIPRVKGHEASLSQRYYCVAKQGLSMLQEDRQRRNHLINEQKKVKSILNHAKHDDIS